MDTWSTTVSFFQEGGIFMYPILMVFGLGLAIAVERWTYLTVSGASNRNLWKKIVPYLKAGNFRPLKLQPIHHLFAVRIAPNVGRQHR